MPAVENKIPGIIKNEKKYFYHDIINIKNFQSNLLKIDQKPYKDFDIYYLGYITIKKFNKFSDHENIHTVNPLYLIFQSAPGYFEEENAEKYLILDSTDNYEEVFSAIKSEIETIIGGEKMYYEKMYYGKNYERIGVNTDDDIPMNKQIKFQTLTIVIRCVFQSDKKLCPQLYLDKCLYEL